MIFWCNVGEIVVWLWLGEINFEFYDLVLLVYICVMLLMFYLELLLVVIYVVLVCGNVCCCVGGLDVDSYVGWNVVLVDFSLCMVGLGWCNVLCEIVFVSWVGEVVSCDGDLEVLVVCWLVWVSWLVDFLMYDLLYGLCVDL